MKDYYKILDIPRDAKPAQIRKAFLRLIRQHHSDVSKGGEDSETLSRELNEAYETLNDPEKRRHYDLAQSKALVTDLGESAKVVVDEYFKQFRP